jgi:hypothetical protein
MQMGWVCRSSAVRGKLKTMTRTDPRLVPTQRVELVWISAKDLKKKRTGRWAFISKDHTSNPSQHQSVMKENCAPEITYAKDERKNYK